MKLLHTLSKWLPTAWSSPYESANPSPRRGRVPGSRPQDTRRDLTPTTRTELIRRSRYLMKNSGFVRELVGNMAIYSTGDGIKPQAQTADPEWNRMAEEYFRRWSARCEITGRFSFEECQSLVCRGMDVDGEYFILKTRNAAGGPTLQLIESHRVGDNTGETSDGLLLDDTGAPSAYRLLEDMGIRDVPAFAMLHVFEPESVTALRNAPSLQHSINHVLDEMELIALEKHAVKDNCDVSRVLRIEQGELDDDGDFAFSGPVREETSDATSLQRIMGGKLVALKPGESLDSFQSNRPSPTFTGFLEHLRRDSALGHIPFEFAADSSRIGGAGVRLVVAKADRRFSYRQLILIQRFIEPVWAYVIAHAIAQRELKPEPLWWRIACVCPRRVSVDAGRESQQNRADVEMGLKTISDHFQELGADFREELERRARDAQMILETARKYGVPVSMLWNPSKGMELVEPPEPDEKPKVSSV